MFLPTLSACYINIGSLIQYNGKPFLYFRISIDYIIHRTLSSLDVPHFGSLDPNSISANSR